MGLERALYPGRQACVSRGPDVRHEPNFRHSGLVVNSPTGLLSFRPQARTLPVKSPTNTRSPSWEKTTFVGRSVNPSSLAAWLPSAFHTRAELSRPAVAIRPVRE